jgi:hypothetical protein
VIARFDAAAQCLQGLALGDAFGETWFFRPAPQMRWLISERLCRGGRGGGLVALRQRCRGATRCHDAFGWHLAGCISALIKVGVSHPCGILARVSGQPSGVPELIRLVEDGLPVRYVRDRDDRELRVVHVEDVRCVR